jgi:hypothetical protein
MSELHKQIHGMFQVTAHKAIIGVHNLTINLEKSPGALFIVNVARHLAR